MPYTRRTWVSRRGTGLNKFRLHGYKNNPVAALASNPDSVTQEGDTLSKNNLNGLEGRIYNAFNYYPEPEYYTKQSPAPIILTEGERENMIDDMSIGIYLEDKNLYLRQTYRDFSETKSTLMLSCLEQIGDKAKMHQIQFNMVSGLGGYWEEEL